MNERNYAIDFIRLVAILGVVVIHTTTAFNDRVALFSLDFYFLHFINQASRFAVPLFFLISGFLLASRYLEIKNPIIFYKKRLYKILIPYVTWSLIYYFIIFPNSLNSLLSKKFANSLLTGDSSYQLYFIPAIIILYLLFPLIVYFKKVFLTKWFISLLFITEFVVISVVYFNNINLTIFPPFEVAFYNLFPFVIGMYSATRISNLNLFIKRNIVIISASTIVLSLYLFIESIFMYKSTGVENYLRNQWRISVFVYGIFAGSLMYYFYPLLHKWNKQILYLSSFSLGVFFVHVAILQYFLDALDIYKFYNIVSFAVTLGGVLILSFVFSIALSKNKMVNKTLGLRG